MKHSVLDLPALFLAIGVSLLIAGVLIAAHGEQHRRRGWIAAGSLLAALIAVGLLDLQRQQTRDTHFATVILGAALPVLGTIAAIRGMRRIRRRWLRWPLIGATTFLLLFAGLLAGATLLPRYLP